MYSDVRSISTYTVLKKIKFYNFQERMKFILFLFFPEKKIKIKFPCPIHIHRVNLLIHEILIPSSQVYTDHFFPSCSNILMNIDYFNFIYDKIVFIKPNSYIFTDFQYRKNLRIALAGNYYYLKLCFKKYKYYI